MATAIAAIALVAPLEIGGSEGARGSREPALPIERSEIGPPLRGHGVHESAALARISGPSCT